MSVKLLFPYGNPRGNKLLFAAEVAGVPVEHVDIPFESLKSEEHLARLIPLSLILDTLLARSQSW